MQSVFCAALKVHYNVADQILSREIGGGIESYVAMISLDINLNQFFLWFLVN